jgi:hypothetical protein
MAETAKRGLLKGVLGLVASELAPLGFKKKNGVYVISLREGFWGTVGLNVAMNRGADSIGINPIVGVRHEAIESLVESLAGEKLLPFAPTISVAIGYLMPHTAYTEWSFGLPPFDSFSEAAKMVTAIQKYGLSFMKEHSSIEAIITDLENNRFCFKESLIFRLPVAYLLSGKTQLAIDYVMHATQNLESRTDVTAQVYRKFAKSFLQQATTLSGGMTVT